MIVSNLTEYAEINPNPNPLGVAYIDDFESSSMSTNIYENFSYTILYDDFTVIIKSTPTALKDMIIA